jgi:hypothetical protein
LVGIDHDQPDELAAVKRAIEEFKVQESQRDRLIARASRIERPARTAQRRGVRLVLQRNWACG